MTCACESEYSFPCQFPEETEFFSFDGKEWCRFHLPLQDAAGNKSAKGRGKDGWEPKGGRRKIFTEEVHARLRAAAKDTSLPVSRADLRGITFPQNFFFYSDDSNKPFHVNFAYARFADGPRFLSSGFHDDADFTGTTFDGAVSFCDAAFGDQVSFADVKFLGKVDFSAFGTTWNATGRDFALRRISFQRATFEKNVSFENRDFAASANFNGAVFHDLVEFHGCAFHPGMSFHQTKFLKTRGANDDETEELERSYRTLKLEMEKLRARNEEADFFALEMECRRQRGSVPPFERFAATAYKHLSDYGRSVDLPLIWLLILTYAAHYLLYLPIALITCNPGPGARLAFTLEQMFRPFYVWAKSAPGTGNCLVENSPLLIPLLASLQSLGTIALLTLFLLALRRRFKMD